MLMSAGFLALLAVWSEALPAAAVLVCASNKAGAGSVGNSPISEEKGIRFHCVFPLGCPHIEVGVSKHPATYMQLSFGKYVIVIGGEYCPYCRVQQRAYVSPK